MKVYASYNELLSDPLWKAKRHTIIWRDLGVCQKCRFVPKDNLRLHSAASKRRPYDIDLPTSHLCHVHHTYYQRGKLPWQYPDETLQTLCSDCHTNLHQTTTVPYLNEDGVPINDLQKCPRCNGFGIVPEYMHVMNGVCFQCWGLGCQDPNYFTAGPG